MSSEIKPSYDIPGMNIPKEARVRPEVGQTNEREEVKYEERFRKIQNKLSKIFYACVFLPYCHHVALFASKWQSEVYGPPHDAAWLLALRNDDERHRGAFSPIHLQQQNIHQLYEHVSRMGHQEMWRNTTQVTFQRFASM